MLTRTRSTRMTAPVRIWAAAASAVPLSRRLSKPFMQSSARYLSRNSPESTQQKRPEPARQYAVDNDDGVYDPKKDPMAHMTPEEKEQIRKELRFQSQRLSSYTNAMIGASVLTALMIFCVLENDGRHLYETIKRVSLTEGSVLTQCMQFKNVRSGRDIKDQYAANVALKINIKLGGASNYVDRLPAFDRPTMLVGADVTHGAPGSRSPSISAVVASVDKFGTNYHTYIRMQPTRTEEIGDMESMMSEALENFYNENGVYPSRIFFFRDGVAASQFKKIRNLEVAAIKKALEARGANTSVTFTIVQKRHHIRIFPTDNTMDRSGNCMPGTIIATEITHPSEFQFILQSHAGIQGMSRPTIYHVIHDENGMSSDEMQQLCFNLCFLAGRATRSISVVAPSYRAHIAAYYARMFLHGDQNDLASVVSGSSGDEAASFRNVLPSIQRTMYYM